MISKSQVTISVIVPVYKVENYLCRCIDSILMQTFTDFELVLVDDGSPDNCGKICDEYAKKDKRITVIHKENGGLSDARNTGIDWAFKNSNSEWITFIDSDDWVDRRYLEILFNAAVENQVDVSVCDFLRTSNFENTNIKESFICQKWDVTDFFVEKNLNFVIACAKLYRKSLFKDVRFPIGKVHEDELTTYKILFQRENIVFIVAMLYYYFINQNSITGGGGNNEWNNNKTDFILAMEERIIYFEEKKLSKALLFQKKQYVESICKYCQSILKLSDKKYKHKYLKYLRKKIRWFIRYYKKDMGITFGKDKWIYELAYPKMVYLYWIIWGRFTSQK